MTRKSTRKGRPTARRTYSDELKAEAVQMMLDGHSAQSVVDNLGLTSTNLLYRWKDKLLQQSGPAATTLESRGRQFGDNLLRPLIRNIFFEHRRRYGARRIAVELAARGETCGRRRVARLMDDMGLKAIQPRTFKQRTTDSRHTLGFRENLLIDASPPRCGWPWRRVEPGLIHHTDRGGQYAATHYRDVLARARMSQSMSRAENGYDNAFMESCFGTLKTELEMQPYQNARIAHQEIPAYIRYYNTRRRHSALGYLTPEAFEAQRN